MTLQLERFLHDEHLESLHDGYDRAALLAATTATYVLHQDVSYEYTAPITNVRQRLMIVPRSRHGDQARLFHRFEVEAGSDRTVHCRSDRFGNSVLHIRAPHVERSIRFSARAIVRRSIDSDVHAQWPHDRPTVTRLTRPDDGLRHAAHELRAGPDPAVVAEAVGDLVHRSFAYAHDVTTVRTTATEAWSGRVGVCQDMAHVMIAMCASLGVAARYVSGHLVGDGASHAWVEVLDHRRGRSIAIDPTHNRRTDLRYITTAIGRDYRDVAPTTGTFVSHGCRGQLRVSKRIRLAAIA